MPACQKTKSILNEWFVANIPFLNRIVKHRSQKALRSIARILHPPRGHLGEVGDISCADFDTLTSHRLRPGEPQQRRAAASAAKSSISRARRDIAVGLIATTEHYCLRVGLDCCCSEYSHLTTSLFWRLVKAAVHWPKLNFSRTGWHTEALMWNG